MIKAYWIIDGKNGDEFQEKFEGTFDEAIEYARNCFNNLTEVDKKQREKFFVISDYNGVPAHLVWDGDKPTNYQEEYYDILENI